MENANMYFNEDEDNSPTPEFDLTLFPKVFQEGDVAYQLTELYSLFLYIKEESNEAPCLTLADIKANLDGFKEELILVLLELLVQKRILKCVSINRIKYWTSRDNNKL